MVAGTCLQYANNGNGTASVSETSLLTHKCIACLTSNLSKLFGQDLNHHQLHLSRLLLVQGDFSAETHNILFIQYLQNV